MSDYSVYYTKLQNTNNDKRDNNHYYYHGHYNKIKMAARNLLSRSNDRCVICVLATNHNATFYKHINKMVN